MVESNAVGQWILIKVCLVRDQKTLAEYTTLRKKNPIYNQIQDHCKTLISRQNNENAQTKSKSEHLGLCFHLYQDKNSILFILVTSDTSRLSDSQASTYLKALEVELYQDMAKTIRNPQALQEIPDFANIVNQVPFPTASSNSRIDTARGDIEEAKGVMQQNLSNMFENSALVQEMDLKAEDLKWTASDFQFNSKKLEQQARRRKIRAYLMLACTLVLFGYLIYFLVQ